MRLSLPGKHTDLFALSVLAFCCSSWGHSSSRAAFSMLVSLGSADWTGSTSAGRAATGLPFHWSSLQTPNMTRQPRDAAVTDTEEVSDEENTDTNF